jgi:L-alanine-DL-glutamate epimerase-like enolase superfamily enzyme
MFSSVTFRAGNPEELVKEARHALEAGFHSVKIKVGALTPEQDIANVKAAREARIMIDANACWHYYQALEIMKKMEAFDLAYCEQPVPWWVINVMARLRKQVRIPIFGDESAAELKAGDGMPGKGSSGWLLD